MTTAEEFISELVFKTDLFVAQMDEVDPLDLGLDRRSAPFFKIDETSIAVLKTFDYSVQYYAEFENVEDKHRTEVGNWVFYSADSEVIQDLVDLYYEEELLVEE